jgi:hypothetical protein
VGHAAANAAWQHQETELVDPRTSLSHHYHRKRGIFPYGSGLSGPEAAPRFPLLFAGYPDSSIKTKHCLLNRLFESVPEGGENTHRSRKSMKGGVE